MYCTKCGTENEITAAFCRNCGKKLLSESKTTVGDDHPEAGGGTSAQNEWQTQAAQSYSQENSYRQLGGWLAVATYGMLVAAAFIMLGAIISAYELIQYARYLGPILLLLGLIDIAIYIPVVYFCLKMFKMIKERDHKFLRFYEMTMLTLCGACFVLMVLGTMSGYISPEEYFKDLLGAIIIFALWMTYFTKSVRVRVYFGGDEYLKQSIILNKIKHLI